MDNSEGFKKSAYLGTAYLIDSNSKEVIGSGQARFDTVERRLESEFASNSMGEHKGTMIVIETKDGYFAPAVRFTYTSMFMGTSTRNDNMSMCLHWPLSKGPAFFLEKFDAISLQIKAKHGPISWTTTETKDKSEMTEDLTITSIRKELGTSTHKKFTVTANSGFGTSHSHDRIDDESIVRRRMRFKIIHGDGAIFDIDELFKALRAFKMYWIASHDLIDCEFTYVKLGDDTSLVLDSNKLSAAHSNVEGYRSAIDLETPLELDKLTKLLHFYFNPENKKALGSSSKIGLAMNRVSGHRYNKRSNLLDHEVLDLVFALQSIAESIAQKEISKQNKVSKYETLKGIDAVLGAIGSIESELPDSVKSFYKKDRSAIYAAISRPTFARSLDVTADKLGIDLTDYRTVIDAVEKARQQVVHSESYDASFLVDLLTQGTTTIEKSEDGKTISMAFGIRKGALDHLYDLLLILINKYLEAYDG